MSKLNPVIGNWYQNAELGSIFEVVALDEDEETIEVQHLDGEVEEYDLDAWRELPIAAVAPPEDWRSGFELSREDAADPDDTAQPPEDWVDAVDHLEADSISLDDDWPE